MAPAERQICAPEIDTEATQQLTWRVPRDVAFLFFAVKETLRSTLWAKHGCWLTDGALLIAPALVPSEVGGALSRRTGDGRLARRAVRQILRLPALRLAILDAELAGRAAGVVEVESVE